MFRKRKLSLFTVAAAAVLLTTGLAAPASARPGTWYDCPDKWFCLYDHYNGDGLFWKGINCGGAVYNIGAQGLGDRANSYWNRTTHATAQMLNWTGTRWEPVETIGPFTNGNNLSAGKIDQIDGVRLVCII
ncbi:peptidase inhibitor family I36 protein [Amycolatopsis sp. BJA-103]|uniref:peptidase inhibitor family I36 protein n=1 Tax=Amycolatopsis sp. BJA-103 TaxID=1911175 RepID=UPI000C785FBF